MASLPPLRPKPTLLRRAMPWVGTLIVVLGVAPVAMTVARGASLDQLMKVAPGLFMVGGGAMLIQKGAPKRVGRFFLGGLVVALVLAAFVKFRGG